MMANETSATDIWVAGTPRQLSSAIDNVPYPVALSDVERRIVTIRGERVILDCDIATMYGVETRQVNQAVKRNRDRFPKGYVFELVKEEWSGLITNCDKSG